MSALRQQDPFYGARLARSTLNAVRCDSPAIHPQRCQRRRGRVRLHAIGRALTTLLGVSIAFLITSLVIVATPGTGALLTISAGLSRGIRSSLVTAFGCTLGIVPHLAAAITGTAALLRASGVAFETVKFLGVAYLLYMAWMTWRDRSPLVVTSGLAPRGAGRVIRSAVLANLLNPKLTIFFFAFLPQFVGSPSSHQVPTMLMLSAVFMVMTFVVFALYGIFAAAVRQHVIDRPRIVRRMRQVFAASFVGLSAKLATTAR
jgi:threonine/homoserine/homoserine lactone efflux protein